MAVRTSRSTDDPRRGVPRTDTVLADPRLVDAATRLGRGPVKAAVHRAQARARAGLVEASAVAEDALRQLPAGAASLTPVLNATGVILHTNLGRASLSRAARDAVSAASGYVDVEYDLESGTRAARGRGALDTLRQALPDAGDVLVVNNGAAALLLAITTLAQGREVLWSRGEMIEIGDGFRLPELIATSGAEVREVGTTNRTRIDDYAAAIGERTGCILKVHPSNFRISGFSASVPVSALARLGPPVVVDAGSGLLTPDPLLPDELDMTTALRDGASLVTASGDKLLGGPQAGLVAGRADLITRLRRHPMARALRVDKLTLAALEATLVGPETPTATALRVDPEELRARALAIAARLGGAADVVASDGAVGGGSAPAVSLAGWALSLPERYAARLRCGSPAVIGRVERGRCLLDLRCIEPDRDVLLTEAIRACT